MCKEPINICLNTNRQELIEIVLKIENLPWYTVTASDLIGLSFERPYLIKSLNLMIAKSTKIRDQNPWFWNLKSAVSKSKICSFKIQNLQIHKIRTKICRFCWNPHFSLRFQQGNIYGQTKDHLPRKVTPIFFKMLMEHRKTNNNTT